MKPKTLREAVTAYLELMSDEDHSMTMTIPENNFIGMVHFGAGRWIRNNWGLWDENSDLHQHFKELGLSHADDMSGVILKCVYRQIHGKDWKVEEQIQECRDYWKNQGTDPDTLEANPNLLK